MKTPDILRFSLSNGQRFDISADSDFVFWSTGYHPEFRIKTG
jgi:hypothetical protein